MLKILIESACESGKISDSDRKLIEHKAQQMGVSSEKVNKMIEEALQKKQHKSEGLESGFISVDDIKKQTPPPPPPPVNEKKLEESKFTDLKPLSTQGAMSIVSQAKQYGKWIIIKRIKPEYKDNPKYRELFMREFENAYHLDHPHIVRLLDKGEDTEGLYYTMEYIDGRPLSQLITPTGVNNDSIAENVARQMLDALSYVHKKQIFHRDLKPDNIYVTFRGDNVKILDFGLAAADYFEDDLLKVGTPRYASPEQMQKGYDVDQRADIFSFGKIFLEMLTGSVNPDSAKDIKNNAYKHIVSKSIEQNPQGRFHNCDEIIRILNNPQTVIDTPQKDTNEIKETKPQKETKNEEVKPPKEPKKFPWWLVILTVVLIGGGIGLYFGVFKDKGTNLNNIISGNKDKDVIAKADSLYKAGDYIEAKKVYESIKEKDEYVNSQIVTLNTAIDDFDKAKAVFDQKNIARALKMFNDVVNKYPDFITPPEYVEKCNEILKSVDLKTLQIDSESSTNKLGLLNQDGYVLVDFQFEEIIFKSGGLDWRDKGLIIVKNSGKYGFIDKNLNFFAKCEYDPDKNTKNLVFIAPNKMKVSKNGSTVMIYVDENGNGHVN